MKKSVQYTAGAAFAAAFFLSVLFIAGVFSNINIRLTDSLYGGNAAINDIVIAGIDDKSLQEIGRWPWDRAVFAEFIEKNSNAHVIGIDVAFFEKSESDTELALAAGNAGNVVLGVEYTRFDDKSGNLAGLDVLEPVEGIKQAAARLGYYNIPLDMDGVNRRISLKVEGGYPSFAEAVYAERFGREFEFENSQMLINFAGPPGSFETVPFSEALKGAYDFSGKIVLVGATSPDFHDEYLVPTSEGKAMPGIEIHANALQSMITRDFISEQSAISVILWIFLISAGAAAAMCTMRIKAATAVLASAAIAYIFLAIAYFRANGTLLNMVYPPLAIAAAYVSSILIFYKTEKKEKRQAINAFKKYVSPEVVKEIMKDPSKLKLGGQKREMTILFSDIRKFTTISEKLTPEELVSLLNDYLTVMSDIIMEKKGVVDKYIGDAIMALWGVPLKDEEHAKNACETALMMRERLAEVQKQWAEKGIPHFEIGIGINTGEAVAGNIGSHQRFDYTAIGDPVNLASRTEGLTKQYGVGVLITENTKKKVKDEFATRRIDLVAVKGKKEPVWVHELVCRAKDAYKNVPESHFHYEKGIDFYLEKKWESAIEEFGKAHKLNHDIAAELFIERCREFSKNPPAHDWNGVFEAKSK